MSGAPVVEDDRVARAIAIATLEPTISNDVRDSTWAIYAPLHDGKPTGTVVRDLTYGPHERHRIDLYPPANGATGPRPILLFVHGGGFVAGDKSVPGTPFYDNVGHFAAAAGFVGATMTYRLAPEAHHPDGAIDVADAVAYLASATDEDLGAEAGSVAHDSIVVMGHSAGAALVASYAADPKLVEASGSVLRGVVLSSGIYAPSLLEEGGRAYYPDPRAADAIDGLASSGVPVLVLIAEHDPTDFQRQASALVSGIVEDQGSVPGFLQIPGHNHFSTTTELGSHPTWFGDRILEFARDATTRTGD